MRKIIVLTLLIAFLIVNTVNAESEHMSLLAVGGEGNHTVGKLADLTLEIKDGAGKVFIETFPLSKMDTQLSTRFAKEIACKFLDIDCSDKDFFYTIKSDSAIIGGPSAGGAIAVLTAVELEHLKFDQKTTMTGTINAGGLIGPVGSINEKIDAAGQTDIKKVLIPKGKRFLKKSDNTTIDLVEYGKEKGIEVVEVSTLNEAIFEFTGKKIKKQADENIDIDENYIDIMESISKDICNRTISLKSKAEKGSDNYYGSAVNLTEKAKTALGNRQFYSAASYCFGANINFDFLIINQANLSKEGIRRKIDIVEEERLNLLKKINSFSMETMTDLQTYMIVNERIDDVQDYLEQAGEVSRNGKLNESRFALAFANERLYSAYAWSSFFGTGKKKIKLDNEVLKNSCLIKISEASERIQYVKLLYEKLDGAEDGLNEAYSDYEKGNYKMCLFEASKAKSEVDIVLGIMGFEEDQLDEYLEEKLKLVKRSIIDSQERGVFPIYAYSYYEYAQNLKSSNIVSALIYSETALELSNLDVYFSNGNHITKFPVKVDYKLVLVFMGGVVAGFLIAIIFKRGKKPVKNTRKN